MNNFHCACLAFLLTWSHACPAADPAATPSGIPESAIAALQNDLAEAGTAKSSAGKRRAYKNVFRDGEDLLEATPAAPNRWQVLGIMSDSRKYLFGMEKSDSNREALLEICAKLAEAPDEYAELRLEADLLLSEKALSAKGATLEERAKAIGAIIERYRGTSAEAKGLMMASLIAPKLGAFELRETIEDTMRDRFGGNHEVIQWRWKHSGLGKMEVVFSGEYTRVDGVTLHFPYDLMGHLGIMVFWSRETPGFESYLKQIRELEVRYPDRINVFSFNLDELPDGGTAVLRELGLDWTVMRLPGGRENGAFRTYARQDPAGIFVNAYGRALLTTTEVQAEKFTLSNHRISGERYLAQLQSLFIGDFLVGGELGRSPSDKQRLASELEAVRACFVPPPFRYRLSREEALANYRKASELAAGAIRAAPQSADLWLMRNHRIIALLGMWNLARDPKYLEQAVEEANAALASSLPDGADVVPRFCLAKAALRRGKNGGAVLPAFVEATGGDNAPVAAVAAAAILAVDASARELHQRCRAKLLAATDGGEPSLWPVVAYLRDRVHTYDLLRANYVSTNRLREREPVRGYMINHGGPPMTGLLPTVTLKTLDGRTLSLPKDTNGKLTLLVFVEPSSEPNAEFPIDAGGEGEDKKLPHHSYLQYACDLADRHVNKDVITIAAFLSEDAERIDALMKTRELTCQAAIVPGGLASPMVRRLGVLSADRIPNVFLLRRNGSIAWHASGLPYEDSEGWVNLLATKVHIENCEVETAYEALKKGNFKEAARVFGGPYLPWPPDRYGWRPPRYHGQALAYMGLKDWNAALESIEKAIDAQKLRYFRSLRYDKNAANWRKEAATVTINHPDDTLVELWDTKAEILDKLGRRDEAAQMRKRSAEPAKPDAPSVYKLFHERLKDWLKQHRMETHK